MIPQTNIITMVITVIALVLLPLGAVLYWKRAKGRSISWRPLIIGAAGFVIVVRVLELLIHMVCIVTDNPVSRLINGSDVLYVLYGITMAGVFEEVGRHVIIRHIMKKNKTRENMIFYGIGHGGIEVLVISLPAVATYLYMAITINALGPDQAMVALNAPSQAVFEPVLATIQGFGPLYGVMAVAERIFAMTLHISLTVVVFYGIQRGEKKHLLIAILLHAIFDLLPAIFSRGLVSMGITELWLLICTPPMAYYAYRLYKKLLPAPEES